MNDDLTGCSIALPMATKSAADLLLPLVYDELRGLAAVRLARLRPGQTLQPTALVHDAYLRIAERRDRSWTGRSHFFFVAARAMRDILVEDARRKASLKRGGNWRRIDGLDLPAACDEPREDLLTLDGALARLEHESPEQYEVVMLRYFTGLTNDEIAELLQTSASTIKRRWRFARAWLHRELTNGEAESS